MDIDIITLALAKKYTDKHAGGSITPEQIQEAVDKYLTENPVQAGATEEQAQQIEQNKQNIETLSNNKLDKNQGIENSGKFLSIGLDGNVITEDIDSYTKKESDERFANKDDIPKKLPNPNVLTFTGAVEDTYDGSESKTINIPTSSTYELPKMTDTVLGGGKAIAKTDESVPVSIDENGQLFVPEQGSVGIDEIDHGTSDTTFALTPNIMHKWGEVESLDLTLSEGTEGIVNEYMFSFISGATATQLSLPATVNGIPVIEPNSIYQCSIVDNCFAYGRWDNNVTV